jgi:FSR family fosmidomycin resistance protein-like MFS transporter
LVIQSSFVGLADFSSPCLKAGAPRPGFWWIAGAALSILELAGIGGALLGGTLSDRVGRKTVLVAAMASSSLLMFVFLNVSGWRLVPVLLALGFTSLSSTPVMLAMVQESVSHNRATANGLFMSMSFLVRPLAVFIIGLLGDNFGLYTAFYMATVVALLAIPMIYFLPNRNGQESHNSVVLSEAEGKESSKRPE